MSLIDKIQQLDIHPDHDVRGGYSTLGDNFANAIDGTGERATQKAALKVALEKMDDFSVAGRADGFTDEERLAQRTEAQRASLDIEQLAKQGVSGIIKTGAAEIMHVGRKEAFQKEEKAKRDAVDMQMLLASMRAELRGELKQIEVRRSDINKMRQGIEDVFAGGYDVGEDGRITNEQAEKALAEYEKRTGKTVNREDEAAVYAALDDQWKAFALEEVGMNKRAGEIKSFMDNELKVAERAQSDPSLSPTQKDAIAKATITQGVALGVAGTEILDQVEVHQEAGREAPQNEQVQSIVASSEFILSGI